MRDARLADVLVIGGAAGTVIAHKLAERGRRVTLLTSGIEGATDTNQKWLHSGLLYPSGRLAERAWSNRNLDWKIKRPYIRGPEQAYILALTDKTISQRSEMWSSWSADSREVPEAQPLQVSDRKKLASLGVRFKGGWKTPNCVLDFPALVRDMRLNISGRLRQNAHLPAPKVMGTVMEGATVLRLRRGTTGIAGVDYEWKGGRGTLLCDQCVLSAGAWSYELLRNIDTDLPLIRKKCLVMAFKPTGRGPTRGVSFDRITVWLDVQKEDGTRADFTIVPFDRRLLAAGTDFRVVYQVGECALENLRAGPSEIAALQREMEQCFVDQRRRPFDSKAFDARTCFKTEQYNSAHPDVDIKVYTDKDGLLGKGHGVPGLIVAIPGKASLMFDLAREASKHVR